MEKGEQDWQNNKTVLECNQYMLEKQLDCDITFTFPEEDNIINAHKFVLISRSPVFYAMLAGPARDESGKISIEDINHDCFWQMLWYVYYIIIKTLRMVSTH